MTTFILTPTSPSFCPYSFAKTPLLIQLKDLNTTYVYIFEYFHIWNTNTVTMFSYFEFFRPFIMGLFNIVFIILT